MSCIERVDNALSHKLANMGLFCACLIVTLHVPLSMESGWVAKVLTGAGIGNIAVPFFFIASGFFFAGHLGEKGWWVKENKKRIFSLLVPYVFWNVFYWIFMHSISWVANKVGVLFGEKLATGLSLGINPFEGPELSYLWFVRCLIVFVLLGPLFLLFKRKVVGGVGLMVLFALWTAAPHFIEANHDWHYSFARVCWIRGLFWFSLGVYLRWNPVRQPVAIGESAWGKGTWALLAVGPWLVGGGGGN